MTRLISKKPLLSDYIRRQRYAMVKPYVTGSVLDVGCGQGYILNEIPSIQKYVGLDVDSRFLSQARTSFPQHSFYEVNIEQGQIPEVVLHNRFNTILMIAILEHLTTPYHILNRLRSVLAPDGVIILTTPTPLGHKIHNIGSKIGLFYQEAADDHKSILSESDLDKLYLSTGLKRSMYQKFEFGCNQMSIITLKDIG